MAHIAITLDVNGETIQQVVNIPDEPNSERYVSEWMDGLGKAITCRDDGVLSLLHNNVTVYSVLQKHVVSAVLVP